jgi:hypothetical protein
MKAWFTVERAPGKGWFISADNPNGVPVPLVHLDAYDDAMKLAGMVASTLRLDVHTRLEETP